MSERLHAPRGLFVKICGVTCARDAWGVAEAGADALGVNLFEGSKRFTGLEACAPWLRELEGGILRVAVVVNPMPEDLARIRAAGVFDAVQFHGEESPAACEGCGFRRWIRALRARSLSELERDAARFATTIFLLDADSAHGRGGTGELADWKAVAEFCVRHPQHQILLAGGLRPCNVAEAVRQVRPFGVDVASGVESAPGVKDSALVRAFVQAARGA